MAYLEAVAGAGLGVGVAGWMAQALYARLVKALDGTAEKLGQVAQTLARIEAGHGARLDALERGPK